LVEYALILVLVAIVVIVALTTMGNAISSKFDQITTGLNGAGGA
jgi:pilus assembly protein Flp/PilA